MNFKYKIFITLTLVLIAPIFANAKECFVESDYENGNIATSSDEKAAYSQAITLKPGWNVVSTPKVLQSMDFSLGMSSFQILTLDPSKSSLWVTMSDLGQNVMQPLFGYFVNNLSSSNQKLTFNYKKEIQETEKKFTRNMSAPGWYLIGPAHPCSAVPQGYKTESKIGNPQNILGSVGNATNTLTTVVDFTDSESKANPDSVSASGTWKIKNKGSGASNLDFVSDISDFRETKGYGVYVNTGTVINGVQNINTPACLNINGCKKEAPESVRLIMSQSTSSPSSRDAYSSGNILGNKMIINEFTLKAEGSDISFDRLRIKFELLNGVDYLSDIVSDIRLVKNDNVIAHSMDSSNYTINFKLEDTETVREGEVETYQVVIVMQEIGTPLFKDGFGISISVLNNYEDRPFVDARDSDNRPLPMKSISGESIGGKQVYHISKFTASKEGFSSTLVSSTSTAPYGAYSVSFKLAASGRDYYILSTTTRATASSTSMLGIVYAFFDEYGNMLSDGTSTAVISREAGGLDEDGYVKITDGTNAIFKINTTFLAATSTSVRLRLINVNYSINKEATTSAMELIPKEDYMTDLIYITNEIETENEN